jgi:hypothetical protein
MRNGRGAERAWAWSWPWDNSGKLAAARSNAFNVRRVVGIFDMITPK